METTRPGDIWAEVACQVVIISRCRLAVEQLGDYLLPRLRSWIYRSRTWCYVLCIHGTAPLAKSVEHKVQFQSCHDPCDHHATQIELVVAAGQLDE